MTAAPERSLQQRLDALAGANSIRTYRKELKRDLHDTRVDADGVLVAADPRIATMRIWDLLLAVPGMGNVRVAKILRECVVSPSKTVGGLSPRQRALLLIVLREHRERSPTYKQRRAALGRGGDRAAA
jgi:hypothetical protein